MASTYELIIKAVDQSSGGLRKIERNVDRLEKKASGLSTTLKAAGGALAAFVTGGAARSIVTTTARFEDLEDTLKSVTGSAIDGAEAFKFVKKFSTQTQFGVEELTQAYIKLAGAGIEPTEKLLTTFTDTAAVTTDQLGTLQAMTDLMSRTTAGGLGLEDLERLADRGVPVYKLLADNLGLARNEITEFGQSQAGAKLITDTLLQALNRTYGGATQGKMDNLSTAMSNFGIAVKNAADQIGQEMRPQLTAAITDATKFIEVNEKMISQMGVGFGGAIRASGQALQMLAENFNAIKNAAIGLIALRAAQTFVNIGTKISSAIKPTQTLAGMFKTLIGAQSDILGSETGGKTYRDLEIARQLEQIIPKIYEIQGRVDDGTATDDDLVQLDILKTQKNNYTKSNPVTEGAIELFIKSSQGQTLFASITEELFDANPTGYESENDPQLYIDAIEKVKTILGQFSGGGRAGYAAGNMVEEQITETETMDPGPMGDASNNLISYDQLRARLPAEITDDIVELMTNSAEALEDFAMISTQADVDQFNRKYSVNLVLPAEA